MVVPALPFCHVTLKTPNPKAIAAYPQAICTIGDHLSKKRLDLDLTQQEVADQIGVFKTMIFKWETNRIAPNVRFMPKIFEFLEYVPYSTNLSFSEKLKIWCQSLGLTQKELAARIGISNSTL